MPLYNATGQQVGFSQLDIYGHSYAQLTTTGISRLGHRWSTLLAAMLGAREINVAINGSKIMWPDNSVYSGGWNTVFHGLLRNRSIARATASNHPPESSVGAFYWGANDWPRLGLAKTTSGGPYGNALRACIAHWRASKKFDSNDASIVYATPANWTSNTSILMGAMTTGASSEVSKASTVAAPGAITITVPSDFPGGAICLYFPVDPTSGASTVTVKVDAAAASGAFTVGGSAVFDNSNDTSGGAAVTANRNCIVPYRITGLAAGAHTIVITPTVSTNINFGGYSIESPNPPPLLVLNAPKVTTAVGYGLWRLTGSHAYQGTTDQMPATDTGASSADTLWDQGNAVTKAVCAEFDARVMYIDVDAAFAKNSIYWPAGDQHPNDRGNAVIASLCFSALQKLVAGFSVEQAALVNTDQIEGDTPSDQSSGPGLRLGSVTAFGRARSAKIFYPCVIGETPVSKTLVASTAQPMTGMYYISAGDWSQYRIRAHVTTALSGARLYAEVQNVFGFVQMDFNAVTRPEVGSLDLSATGMYCGAWTPFFPQLRRGDFQLRFSLYGATAGTVAFTNAGIEFR